MARLPIEMQLAGLHSLALQLGLLDQLAGTALRAALVGKKVASASKAVTAIPSGKALVAMTDTVADLVGQPALGAIDAALKGDDPGVGAVGGVGAAGTGVAFDIATGVGESKSGGVGEIRGAPVAVAKTIYLEKLKVLDLIRVLCQIAL